MDDKTALTPVPEIKQLKKRLDLSSFPSDWRLTTVSIDWQGEPLVLFQEGKPPRPQPDAGMEATVKWMNTPPKKLERVWENLGANRAIAVRGDRLVVFPAYDKPYLVTRTFENPDTTIWELADSDGRFLSNLAGGPPETTRTGWYVPFRCVARDGRVYVYDETALCELP